MDKGQGNAGRGGPADRKAITVEPLSKKKMIPLAGQKRKLPCTEQLPSPAEYVMATLKEKGYKTESYDHYSFPRPSTEMVKAYTVETLQAMRDEDLDKLRELKEKGASLDCCNRFGESLLHMACRRGCTEIVQFLVCEASCSLLIRDDFGRTPLHDACWTPKPVFSLVEFIIRETPELICVKDVRGHTPLDYVRKEHWEEWRGFLRERKDHLFPDPTESQLNSST